MIRTTLRKKYHGLSREELLDLVYEMGVNYMKHSGSCSQSTVAAIHELVEMDDVAVRVASSSAGGQLGQAMGTCGALIGSTIVLDYFFGRPANTMSYKKDMPANAEQHIEAIQVATPFIYKYIREYGTILCPQIQMGVFGRHFYFMDDDDMRKFEAAGGHEDKCTNVVAKAARWTMEILLAKGVIG